jgi:aspartyl-tRNA(Asn)/glutamyl-tRNA(Gln) amidotransferase subunit B
VEAKTVANWVTGDLFGLLNKEKVEREDIGNTHISAEHFGKLIMLVENKTVNAQTVRKQVLPIMWETGKDPQAIVDAKGLGQISDESAIADKVQEAMNANADMVQRYLDGNDKVFNAIFGKTMALLKGKGDAQLIRQILQDKLDGMK